MTTWTRYGISIMMTNLNQGIEDRNRERKNCELVTAEKAMRKIV